jgi:hypothetical protein
MKVRLSSWHNRVFKLTIEVPKLSKDEQPLIAVSTNYEGTGCWSIEDLRLYPRVGLEFGRYFGNSAENFHSSITVKTEAEYKLVSSLVPVHTSDAEEFPKRLHWCTYKGIVRGSTAAELGLTNSWMAQKHDILHRYKPMLEKMHEIKAFWEEQAIDEGDPELSAIIAGIKLNNPFLQPSESNIMSELIIAEVKLEQEQSA